MKAKVLAALAATMAVSATCAFAANPFVDVPTDSWAYKSVVELADAGVIQGVDGEYFQGQRNITRYEAAEMVAKAMAHMDKASVEQRALINKLADEYADELNNLGVRVSNLENKVGNIKFTGDARLRYRYQNGVIDNDDSWQYRIRLRGQAQVNDRTTVTLGLTTDNQTFGGNGATSSGDTDDGDIFADIIKMDYNFGSPNWNLSLGREAEWVLGGPRAYGYQYGDVFDRAQLQYNNGKFAVTAGYGKFKEGSSFYDSDLNVFAGNNGDVLDGVKTGYGEIEGFFGNGSAIGVYYNDFTRAGGSGVLNGAATEYVDADDLWGAYASVNIGSKWNVLANYEKVSKDGVSLNRGVGYGVDDPEVWIGRVTYGKTSMSTPKSWDVWVEYLDAEDGAFLGGSTNSWRFGQMDNITSWGAGIDYVFAKNAMFSVMQSFATDVKDSQANASSVEEEQTRAQFVFAF